MVRVISVHNFASQYIQTVEQPTACTIAAPDKLLLALSSHLIEVRDLKSNGDVLFCFPTVDEVTQLVYCSNGDYVATLETKFNRQNVDLNFVRVYINWDSIATMQQSKMTSSGVSLSSSECGMVQPMRARIAGRVTPTTNQSELGSLEMIEIPMRRNPDAISCCQISGNILILAKKTLIVYTFLVKVHDISKLRFIDFEEAPLQIELSFLPNEISFCENYIACMNNDHMHMFKVVPATNPVVETSGEDSDDFNFKYAQNNKPIDFKQLLQEESLNPSKSNFTVHLPTIVRENSAIHKYSPFTFCDKDLQASVKATINESQSCAYSISNLIQLKLIPVVVESAQRQVAEEFKSMVVKPLYIDQDICKNVAGCEGKSHGLRSSYSNLLHSVVCMVATQQEGYLYQFTDSDELLDVDNCIAVYPFTSPVYKLIMEDYFLHALTETGLETYTLRTGHQLCRKLETIDNYNVACPAVNDSVCLVGLRPFLGVEKCLLSEGYLVLLASADTSPTHSIGSNSSSTISSWTMYTLKLPSPKTIFNDISVVANVHRFSSSQTYCHLMSEAHMILRLALLMAKWTVLQENVALVMPNKRSLDDVVETYRTSCALLGDHYVMSSVDGEYQLGLPYYRMAGIHPNDALKRVNKVQQQSNSISTKGLLYYLKSILLDPKFNNDVEKFFASNSKQSFVEAILELCESHYFDDLPKLVLKCGILREYFVDRLLKILSQKVSNDSLEIAEKSLALAVLHVQRCSMKKAQDLIGQIEVHDLQQLLVENWEILFDFALKNGAKTIVGFSEVCIVLFGIHPDLLAQFFASLIRDNKAVSLGKILKLFVEYLPSNIDTDGNVAGTVLQKMLELYFLRFFAANESSDLPKIIYDRPTNEAMKILVRSYLSQLQILQMKENGKEKNEERHIYTNERRKSCIEDDDDKDSEQEKDTSAKMFFQETETRRKSEGYVLAKYRHEYLDKMPPFQVEITAKLYEACTENFVPKECSKTNEEADLVLKKLQALLCSGAIPKQLVSDVNAFLVLNEELRGNHSLRSITMSCGDTVLFLVDVCPQCLLQYAKDRFTKTDEWKYLVATVQQRILKLSQDEQLKRVCFFHKKILKDILTYAATNMDLEQLICIFPQKLSIIEQTSKDEKNDSLQDDQKSDMTKSCNGNILDEIQNYEPYVVICKETMHANQIKKLIITTSQQILCTFNE